MDLIVNQMVQLQIVHEAYGGETMELLACTAVPQLNLALASDLDALPFIAVVKMGAEVLHDLRSDYVVIFVLEILPCAVDIVVGHLEGVHNIIFIRPVKYGSGDVKAQAFCRKAQVSLKYLADVHT